MDNYEKLKTAILDITAAHTGDIAEYGVASVGVSDIIFDHTCVTLYKIHSGALWEFVSGSANNQGYDSPMSLLAALNVAEINSHESLCVAMVWYVTERLCEEAINNGSIIICEDCDSNIATHDSLCDMCWAEQDPEIILCELCMLKPATHSDCCEECYTMDHTTCDCCNHD